MSLKRAKEALKSAAIATALFLGIPSHSKAQDAPDENKVQVHASAYTFAGDSQGFGGSAGVHGEDIGIQIDYAGTREYPFRQQFAQGEIKLYDFYAGGGAIGEQWGAYAAYRPQFRIGNDTIALNSALNLSAGYGHDDHETQSITSKLYAAGIGARLELDINPCSFINTKIGTYAEGFLAAPDDVAYQPRDIDNKQHRYEYLSTILSLSEGRAGAYAEINAALYRSQNNLALLRLRHTAETVQWDLSLLALPHLEINYFDNLKIDPYQLRHITRAEISLERRFSGLHFLVGLFAQHTINSRTFETPLHRNGFSTGATLLANYGIADLRLEGEIYPSSQIREYTRKEPRASLLTELGLTFGGEEHALRAFAGVGINRSRDAFTGLAQEGTLFYGGLAYEFGGGRRGYDAVNGANITQSVAQKQHYAQFRRQNEPETTQQNYERFVRQRPQGPITITREEAQTLIDVINGEKPFQDARSVITSNPDLNLAIDVDALEDIYNASGGTEEDLKSSALSSDLLLGYSQGETTVNIFSQAANEGIEHEVEQGIVLSITPNQSIRELMAEQRSGRATLVLGRNIYTFRQPAAEGFMRLLGYRGIADDLIYPRFEFKLR